MKEFLDFEQPIIELESKIQELKLLAESDNAATLEEEINRLKEKSQQITKNIFQKLTPWNIVQLARHPKRPQSNQYLKKLTHQFFELKGDKHSMDDLSILGGIAKIQDQTYLFVGQKKGLSTKEKLACNFGMTRPEGYRKAARLFKMAEQLKLPILTMVDTPGAYPGIDAEKHNQSEAIAKNLEILTNIKTPVISIITGEGGSGGALALSISDHLAMLEYSIYSVISPEGCASILWKDSKMAENASEVMKMTSKDLLEFNLIDQIIEEPLGGAHKNIDQMTQSIQQSIVINTKTLQKLSIDELIQRRYQRITQMGEFTS